MNSFSTLCNFAIRTSNPSLNSFSKRITIDVSGGNNFIDLSTNSITFSRTAAGFNNNSASENNTFALIKYNNNFLNATDLASFTNFTIYLKYANKYSSLPLFNSRFPSKISIDKNSVPIGNTVTLQLFSLLLYGTPVQYVISGCNSADLSNASLTGSFFAPYQAITYYALASGLGKTPTISISGGNQVTFSIG